jgi:ABC-type branched-subunit amino acid transport system ATPase component
MKRIILLFLIIPFFSNISFGGMDMMKKQNIKKATFAGGCFWCLEAAFKDIPGVIETFSCYTGGIKENREKAMELLKQVGLEDNFDKTASSLSYGQWKLLEFVRAVMTDPTLIFLDEPTPGVTLKLVQKTIDFIHLLNEKGTTFVVVEHNMKVIMNLCDKIFVLEHGKKISEGTPKEIQNDPEVIRAYLGEDSYS